MRVYSKVGAAKILTCFAVVHTKLSRKIAKRRGGEWRFEEKTDVKGTSKNTPIFSTTLLIYFVMRTLFTFSAKNIKKIKNNLGPHFRNFLD